LRVIRTFALIVVCWPVNVKFCGILAHIFYAVILWFRLFFDLQFVNKTLKVWQILSAIVELFNSSNNRLTRHLLTLYVLFSWCNRMLALYIQHLRCSKLCCVYTYLRRNSVQLVCFLRTFDRWTLFLSSVQLDLLILSFWLCRVVDVSLMQSLCWDLDVSRLHNTSWRLVPYASFIHSDIYFNLFIIIEACSEVTFKVIQAILSISVCRSSSESNHCT